MPLRMPELTPEQRGLIAGLRGSISDDREPFGKIGDSLIWRTGVPAGRLIVCKIVTKAEVSDGDEYEPHSYWRPFVNIALENPSGSGKFTRFRRNWQVAIDPEYWTDHLDNFNRIFFLRQNYGEDCIDEDMADQVSIRAYDEPYILFSGSNSVELAQRIGVDMDKTDFHGDDINFIELT